tara:strand:+ start:395 stop:544 length:150 start_codon:yes stop_codon:yes gene_type:complete
LTDEVLELDDETEVITDELLDLVILELELLLELELELELSELDDETELC